MLGGMSDLYLDRRAPRQNRFHNSACQPRAGNATGRTKLETVRVLDPTETDQQTRRESEDTARHTILTLTLTYTHSVSDERGTVLVRALLFDKVLAEKAGMTDNGAWDENG